MRFLHTYPKVQVIVPVNINNTHWSIAVLKVSKFGVEKSYFDGYGGQGTEILSILERWFKQYLTEIANLPPPAAWWCGPSPSPQQPDGHSCGPACLLAMDQIMRGRMIDFDYTIIPTFRKVIALELMEKKLISRGDHAPTDAPTDAQTDSTEKAETDEETLSDDEAAAVAAPKAAEEAAEETKKAAEEAKKAAAISEARALKESKPEKFEPDTEEHFQVGDIVIHKSGNGMERICKVSAVHPPLDDENPDEYYDLEILGCDGVEIQTTHDRLRKATDTELYLNTKKVS